MLCFFTFLYKAFLSLLCCLCTMQRHRQSTAFPIGHYLCLLILVAIGEQSEWGLSPAGSTTGSFVGLETVATTTRTLVGALRVRTELVAPTIVVTALIHICGEESIDQVDVLWDCGGGPLKAIWVFGTLDWNWLGSILWGDAHFSKREVGVQPGLQVAARVPELK